MESSMGRRTKVQRVCTAIFLLVGCVGAQAQDVSPTQATPEHSSNAGATLIDQANDALVKRDYPTALKLLTRLNRESPNEPHILYNLGLTEDALDQTTAAEADYRKSIAADANFAEPRVGLGLLLARAGKVGEAREQLAAATGVADAAPVLKARAYRALARLDLSGDPPATKPDPVLASSELLAALKLTAETPEDVLMSAELAEAVPDLATAEQAYRRYLDLPAGHDDSKAIAALAHVLLAEHHAAEAETLLAPAVAEHPGEATLTAQLAAARLASGDPAKVSQAGALLDKLHTTNPMDANVTRLLARVYVETGHPEQGDPLYAALISAQSQGGKKADPTLLDDRAEALMRMHRPGEAETLLKLATADRAGFPTPEAFGEAATHLAFASAEIDDPKMTLQALTLRATVLPSSPQVVFLEAMADDTLHQSLKAVELYKEFLAQAKGQFPNQELQARQRLAELSHKK
jgi:tetratricopeptide (TPR) repeat protein